MKKINILIIEDDTILSLHISSVLKKMKFNVIGCVKNEREAFVSMGQQKADIILSDIRIQGKVDGIDVCKNIQNIYDIPIVFLTAYKDEDTLLRASDVNFSGYLLKPFREDELEAILKLTVKKHNLDTLDKFIYINKFYTFNLEINKLLYNNQVINLTQKEDLLIALLIHSKNNLVTYEMIDSTIWSDEPNTDANRRQLLFRLKNKLPNLGIQSISKMGIKLVV